MPAYVRFCAGLRFGPPARRCQGAMQERFSLGGVSLVSAPYPANLAVTSLIVEGGFGSRAALWRNARVSVVPSAPVIATLLWP